MMTRIIVPKHFAGGRFAGFPAGSVGGEGGNILVYPAPSRRSEARLAWACGRCARRRAAREAEMTRTFGAAADLVAVALANSRRRCLSI
jgi:hypothetical protein